MAIKVLIGTPALNGASGVQTVTGDGVNNTDPSNPVVSFPTPTEIGALQSGDNVSELFNDANYVNQTALDLKADQTDLDLTNGQVLNNTLALDTKTNKALTQTLVNSTPKVIVSTDSDTTFNVYGVGALCEFTINTGALNVGEAFEVNIGDADGVDVVGGIGVNVFGIITGSTTVGDSLLIRRITDNSFGLTGEVYKVY
jgi:hypothetical protein